MDGFFEEDFDEYADYLDYSDYSDFEEEIDEFYTFNFDSLDLLGFVKLIKLIMNKYIIDCSLKHPLFEVHDISEDLQFIVNLLNFRFDEKCDINVETNVRMDFVYQTFGTRLIQKYKYTENKILYHELIDLLLCSFTFEYLYYDNISEIINTMIIHNTINANSENKSLLNYLISNISLFINICISDYEYRHCVSYLNSFLCNIIRYNPFINNSSKEILDLYVIMYNLHFEAKIFHKNNAFLEYMHSIGLGKTGNEYINDYTEEIYTNMIKEMINDTESIIENIHCFEKFIKHVDNYENLCFSILTCITKDTNKSFALRKRLYNIIVEHVVNLINIIPKTEYHYFIIPMIIKFYMSFDIFTVDKTDSNKRNYPGLKFILKYNATEEYVNETIFDTLLALNKNNHYFEFLLEMIIANRCMYNKNIIDYMIKIFKTYSQRIPLEFYYRVIAFCLEIDNYRIENYIKELYDIIEINTRLLTEDSNNEHYKFIVEVLCYADKELRGTLSYDMKRSVINLLKDDTDYVPPTYNYYFTRHYPIDSQFADDLDVL